MNEFVKQVTEFQRVFDPANLSVDKNRLENIRCPDNIELLKLRYALIREEFEEFANAVARLIFFMKLARGYKKSVKNLLKHAHKIESEWKNNKVKLADALGDILVVTIGTALALGLDIEEIMRRIHKSNMSKLGSDGKPIYRSDGKVMKGPNYKPPVLEDLVL